MVFIAIAAALILGMFGAGAAALGDREQSRGMISLGFGLIWLAIGIGYFAGSWS